MTEVIEKRREYTYQEARDLTDRIKAAMLVRPQRPKPKAIDPDRATDLYRCFDANGALLYVGISLSTAARMGQHRSGASWWGSVATIEVDHYATRTTARKAELEAIRKERPAYNREGANA